VQNYIVFAQLYFQWQASMFNPKARVLLYRICAKNGKKIPNSRLTGTAVRKFMKNFN
jgi:hypothetical protein